MEVWIAFFAGWFVGGVCGVLLACLAVIADGRRG
jgi:hypothetical protein